MGNVMTQDVGCEIAGFISVEELVRNHHAYPLPRDSTSFICTAQVCSAIRLRQPGYLGVRCVTAVTSSGKRACILG